MFQDECLVLPSHEYISGVKVIYTPNTKRNVSLSIPTALINYEKKRSWTLELGVFYSRKNADFRGDITSIELTKIIVDTDVVLKSETAHTTH